MRPTRPMALVGAAAVLVAFAVSPASAASAAPHRPAVPARSALPTTKTVTLVTGDVVRVGTQPDGRRSVTLLPGPDGTIPQAAITQVGKHLYVVPRSAVRLLSSHLLNPDLFDVATLVADGYDDAARSTLPIIVDYGHGAAASARAAAASVRSARRTHLLRTLGDAAFVADKKHAHQAWSSLTTGVDGSGAPTALAGGAVRIDLDGRVKALDDYDPLQQIHVQQAWAAGFDGAGVKIAILDTGYDATHPDLTGKVSSSANFTPEADVTDGNGHGTHVAGTIAGSGAASAGLHKGVSPGATLMIGKVLGSDGSGADSQVLAGMEWAVAQHADIVSMSLGGDTGDGTDPLSQAVDELSATSPTLFVIAAGNNGSSATTVTSPGAADAALTVGAVDSTDTMAPFSSRGPRLDGTVKPEVVAPGVDIVAARAAGTSLGNPVDQYYTSLSGTSMATPHVAGLAAILKQEHPDWDGERLKAAIVGSTVPVGGATVYDAGTGRVDALRAIDQTVVADPTLNLGFFRWPHTNLAPATKTLTYTNLGGADVTYALTEGSQDGVAAAPPGVSLSTDHITVPAGGQATVAVTVDPSAAGPGAYSGVVTATPAGGGQTVRTAFGYILEDERYDVTVVVTPRTGTQSASHIVALAGLDDYSYTQRTLDAASGQQRVTFRVAPGRYATSAVSFGTAKDNSQEGVLDEKPLFAVKKDTTIVLDENATKLLGYKTDKPVVNDGAIMNINWVGKNPNLSFGATLAGSVDRLYTRPMVNPGGGTVSTLLNMQLSAPEGLLTLAAPGSAPIGLRPVTDVGQSTWITPVPVVDGSFRIVDAGSVSALRTGSVRGRIALVAGSCADMTAAADALAKAGAAALVTYPGHGYSCAGTITGTPPLPSFRTRPLDAARLLSAAGSKARLTTEQSPAYVYDLAGHWPDTAPDGATLDGTGKHVATLVEDVRSMGGTTASDGLGLFENMTGVWPDLGWGIYGLTRLVPMPSVVTHYMTPGPNWERDVTVLASQGGAFAVLAAPAVPVVAGTTTRDTWFGGPMLSGNSRLFAKAFGWGAEPNRQGDLLFGADAPLVDSAGHLGTWLYDGEYYATLSSGGTVLAEGPDPLYLNFVQLPPQRQAYTLDVRFTRANPFWKRSTGVHTVWGFSSQTPKSDHQVLPLMQVGLDMALSQMNDAAAGAYGFGLKLSMPLGVTAVPVLAPTVEISWDGGVTWRSAGVRGCGAGKVSGSAGLVTRCGVSVQNKAGGTASLRVSATDTSGRSVTETIVDAYAVR